MYNPINIHDDSQRRTEDQLTFHRRNLPPLLKHTYIYHNYAYGWIPETVIWNSRYEDLNISNYYPIDVGLLNKFEFLFSLYRGPVPQYEQKLNTQFINLGAFRGKINDFYKKFSALPTDEYISFLLLTSIPIYNILYFFKSEVFNPAVHSLFNEFYVDNESHVELAKYLIRGGDYKPIFSRLTQPGLYDGTLNTTGIYNIRLPRGAVPQEYYRHIESLANISTIITYTNKDPVLLFLMFYLPGLSVTTEITPAVEMLMTKLNLTRDDVTLV